MSSSIVAQPDNPECASDLWSRCQSNWRYLASQCVKESSADTYSTAWKHWSTFCEKVSTDVFLQTPSTLFVQSEQPFSFLVVMVVSFISYLHTLPQQLKFRTINTYISGVRHFFRVSFQDISQFDHPVISQCRASLELLHRRDVPEADEDTLPFICDWFFIARRCFSVLKPREFVFIVAMELAFVCLLRVSEVLPTTSNHYLRSCDVEFSVIIHGVIHIIPSASAHLYSLSDVVAVTIVIRSAKNDGCGRGYKYSFERLVVTPGSVAFDIVADLFSWASVSGASGQEAFFSYRSRLLEYHEFNNAVKLVAQVAGANADRFSTHSLRIGGATVLSSCDMPDYYIQNMGRWKSLAFLHYLHWSTAAMKSAMSVLVNPMLFTMKDLHVQHPSSSK